MFLSLTSSASRGLIFASLHLLLHSQITLAQERKVFAHWMLGLVEDSLWDRAISNAKAAGIDGFALNTGPEDAQLEALHKAYAAGERNGFGMFISFDMGCCGPWQVDKVSNWINTFKESTAQVRVDAKAFHSTFEGYDFSRSWGDVKARTGELYIVPSWTYAGGVNGVTENLDVIDGAFNWDAWPVNRGKKDVQGDLAYINALHPRQKTYMMSVSPWMYTNIQGTTYSKNWLLQSDTLWFDRWEQVLDLQPDFVEIVTWNDYGESHYIGSLDEGWYPPEMAHFVDNIDHTAWQAMLPYYIQAYKSGSRDIAIPNEGAVFWYRTTPKAQCSDGGTPCGSGSEIPVTECVEDAVFVVTMSNEDTKIQVWIGDRMEEFQVQQGVKIVKMAFAGSTGAVKVSLRGKTGTGPRNIENVCPESGKVNFNPVVGKAM